MDEKGIMHILFSLKIIHAHFFSTCDDQVKSKVAMKGEDKGIYQWEIMQGLGLSDEEIIKYIIMRSLLSNATKETFSHFGISIQVY